MHVCIHCFFEHLRGEYRLDFKIGGLLLIIIRRAGGGGGGAVHLWPIQRAGGGGAVRPLSANSTRRVLSRTTACEKK